MNPTRVQTSPSLSELNGVLGEFPSSLSAMTRFGCGEGFEPSTELRALFGGASYSRLGRDEIDDELGIFETIAGSFPINPTISHLPMVPRRRSD